MNYCVTSVSIGNDSYPLLKIHWAKDEDGLGWNGQCVIWEDGGKLGSKPAKMGCDKHHISIRQSIPLGEISVTLDGCSGGAWKVARFGGHTLTERDLEWATCWAILGIDKHRRSVACGPRSKKND